MAWSSMPVMPERNSNTRKTVQIAMVTNTASSNRLISARRNDGARRGIEDLPRKVAQPPQRANGNLRASRGQLLAQAMHQRLHRVLAPLAVDVVQQVAEAAL